VLLVEVIEARARELDHGERDATDRDHRPGMGEGALEHEATMALLNMIVKVFF
jgi:hypothetical protein